MNREETIKWLESLKAEIGKSEHRALWHYAEAIDMTIEALKRENHDGCDGCRYEENDELTVPCTSCKQNYTDKYTSMPKHDRDWIVGCIKHDGFIKTDRGDKANQIILEALKADRPRGEWISVSERLPSEKKAVLICDSGGNRFVGELILTDHGYKWKIPLFTVWMDIEDGDAWMPLPKPFGERSEE